MSFNNVPVNGWPQIKDLEKLDALAKQIEDMPTFSSSDRAWLDEWEDKLPELPEDPVSDGVKVLTATTESGETVKSWEDPATGSVDYSTTAVNTGKKWIDGKDVYERVVEVNDDVSTSNTAWVDVPYANQITNMDTLISCKRVNMTESNLTERFAVTSGKLTAASITGGLCMDNTTKLVIEYTVSTT